MLSKMVLTAWAGVNCVGVVAAVMAATMFAWTQSGARANDKKSGSTRDSVARGKDVFDKKCGLCHNADSDVKKIGPGLKGIFKRGTFTINTNKITDQSLKLWIETGDALMPPFKDVLDANQIKDVVAYVRTL
jgi:mono/diheme cytochrome c family protein